MKVFLAALILIGAGVFIMCFNIFFRGKAFPDSDVGTNPEMRKLGIRCYKDIDAQLHGDKSRESQSASCDGLYGPQCDGCSLKGLDWPGKK